MLVSSRLLNMVRRVFGPLHYWQEDKYMLPVDDRLEFIMVLNRYLFMPECTMGRLVVLDKVFHTLEPVKRLDYEKPRCINPGKYRIEMEWSAAFDMVLPELKGVPDFEEIKLHRGNWPKNTKGCILPGVGGGTGYVNDSRIAMKQIIEILNKAAAEHYSLWIEIIEGEKLKQN